MVPVEQLQVAPVHGGDRVVPHLLFGKRHFQWRKDFLLLPLPFGQLPLYFGVQGKGDTPLAVESLLRYFVGEIRPDDPVQDRQTLLDGMLLKGVGRQYRHFFVRQVIDHIGCRLLGLYGQRPCLPIDDQAVRGKAFLPFLVGEIDRRGYQLLVGTRGSPLRGRLASGVMAACRFCNTSCCPAGRTRFSALVVETVAAA